VRPVRPATTPRAWRLTTVAIIAAVLVASYLAFGPAARMYEASPIGWPSEPFTPATWRTAFRGDRYLLFKDLDRQKLLRERPRAAVLELLGPPDAEAPDGRGLTYILWEWDGRNDLQNAAWLLQVDLDGQGKVSGYEVRKEEGKGKAGT
jgi:hypothetical protein